MGDKIEEFMSITTVGSRVEAENWLEAAHWDVAAAVELYYSSYGDQRTAVARTKDSRKREEKYQDSIIEAEIRKPDTVKRQRLVDSSFSSMHSINPAFFKNVASTFTSGSHEISSEKDKRLATLFKPPHDIMLLVDFWNAREKCKAEAKWLLVNIQQEDEFKCHELNRDVWSDDFIKEAIKSTCLFWQQQRHSTEGSIYIDRYKVISFPHIAIIDPRTGALIWTYEGRIDAETFGERFMDFLGSHPYPDNLTVAASLSKGSERCAALSHPVVFIDNDEDVAGGIIKDNHEENLVKTDPDLFAALKQSMEEMHGRSSETKCEPASITRSQVNQPTQLSEPLTGPSSSSSKSGGRSLVERNDKSSSSLSSSAAAYSSRGFITNDLPLDCKDRPDDVAGPIVRIMLRIQQQAAARLSVSVPISMTLSRLAAQAVQLVNDACQQQQAPPQRPRRFELWLSYPRKALSLEAAANPATTLADVGITSDTAINVQILD